MRKIGVLILAIIWLVGALIIIFEGLTTEDKRHNFWLELLFLLWLATPFTLMVIFP